MHRNLFSKLFLVSLILLFFHLAGGAILLAQDEAAAEQADPEKLDLLTLILKGGWVMVPIAIASVLALSLAIERFITLRRSRIVPPDFIPAIRDKFENGSETSKGGMEYCDKNPCVLGNLIKAGIPNISKGVDHLQRALEETGAREVDRMKRSLKPLSMIAAVAPLLGLLGTVYGMISAFQAASIAGIGKADILAKGIYEALVTTAAGLTLAIPVLIIYQILNNRVDSMVDVLDDRASEFMEIAAHPEAK